MSSIDQTVDEKRVLVVDDTHSNRILLCDMLSLVGLRSETAEDGADGLEKYKQNRDDYRLIITDLNMPRMNGIEMMRSILQHGNGVPVILSTTMYPEMVPALSREGFADFLPKPFSFDTFYKRITRYLI